MKEKNSLDLNQFIESSSKIDMRKYPHIKPIRRNPMIEYLQRMYPGATVIEMNCNDMSDLPTNIMYEDDIVAKIKYFISRGFNNGFFNF